ncbi:MAG TPA: hypothetical protein VEG60_07020 [Candidatus Binatia bacterium]|nr:hypothetical protein [Candidatus Binatia bacterium]
MKGSPTQFEAIGNRLGFQIAEETDEKLCLVWQGPRFPAFLCLGIAFFLLFISVPILYAISLHGWIGPAGSLWYFPFMNVILFGISFYLLSQKRTIVIDNGARQVTLQKRSLYQTTSLSVVYPEIKRLALGVDQVYSGFAVAGSSAAQAFPVPSLRLFALSGESILLDRGSLRRLEELGRRLSARLDKPLEVDPGLRR